jgi:cob(I)alamin adenosyltransferase
VSLTPQDRHPERSEGTLLKLTKGYIQVYTGDGKGKTTAAIGLAVRAAGAGLKVFIGQFIKGMDYAELHSLKRFDDLITLKQYGSGCFITGEPSDQDRKLAQAGLAESKAIVTSGEYDLVILDEINVAHYFELVSTKDILSVIYIKPDHVELVFTGRRAPRELIDRADLVTEMREIKHYYQQGVEARVGIEK